MNNKVLHKDARQLAQETIMLLMSDMRSNFNSSGIHEDPKHYAETIKTLAKAYNLLDDHARNSDGGYDLLGRNRDDGKDENG